MLKTELLEALATLSEKWQARESGVAALWERVRAAVDPEQEERALQEVLRLNARDPQAWHQLAALFLKQRSFDDAYDAVRRALQAEPLSARHHLLFGRIRQACRTPQRDRDYLQTVFPSDEAEDPDLSLRISRLTGKGPSLEKQDWLQLELMQAAVGDLAAAEGSSLSALAKFPRDPVLWRNRAEILAEVGRTEAALRARALHLYHAAEYVEAIEHFRLLLGAGLADAEVYVALSKCYWRTRRFEEGVTLCREAIARFSDIEELHALLVRCVLDQGKTEEAKSLAAAARARFPDNLLLQMYELLALPFVYSTDAQVKECRARFALGLERLCAKLDTPARQEAALAGLVDWTNFYLPYQGEDDTRLQARYGQFVTRIMRTLYPEIPPRTKPEALAGRRIRVGYLSAFFRWHSVANTTLGWLLGHDRRQFEVFTYYTGEKRDPRSSEFERAAEHFRHVPFPRGFPDSPREQIEELIHQVLDDKLDILVYPDLGMWPPATMLASLRLASVQCTSWGHPVTSGITNVDYYLSGDLMEPGEADRHYSEHLVRLPGLGVAYPDPGSPQKHPSRARFDLPDDAVVYLSCQSLYKYLPPDDHVFADIAREVPNARFVFLEHGQPAVDAVFRARLEAAFARRGLKSTDHCRFLPQMDYVNYRGLFAVADVFLDTIRWSGANTAFEAIATGLPLVTVPGEFMRGRHCYALLRLLALDELIAGDKDEYVKIAARLGSDVAWRSEVRGHIRARKEKVFGDRPVIAALEDFYRTAIARCETAGS